MKVLFLGDIVGRCGIDAAFENVPDIREKYGIDFCIANCENSAGGFGVTREVLYDLQRAGVDAFTGGNHIFSKKEHLSVFEDASFDIARPYNLPISSPGKGYVICRAGNVKIGIINLLGNLFMDNGADNAFKAADAAVKEVSDRADIIIVDFHAEATSEKKALGYFLDGKVSAVFGTHTHIQTADEEILPLGTAYITDVGMCGAKNSVLGAKIAPAVARFVEGGRGRYEGADGERVFCGIIADFDESGKAIKAERVKL